MRQWYPPAGDEPEDGRPDLVYADLPPLDTGRWVGLGMVASLDGAVTVDGRSGPLGSEGDQAAFRGLRAAADVVLVGAGTARREGYGPPKVRPDLQARRRERGQAPVPAMAVVSRSLDLSGAEGLLDGDVDLHVLTCASSVPARRDELEARGASVVVAGEAEVDLDQALAHLAGLGLARVLGEGGPTLNGHLLAAGLVDEILLTVGAQLVGTEGVGIAGPPLPSPVPVTLLEGRVHGDEVLLRYAVGTPDPR